MDFVNLKLRISDWIRKYKYVWIVLFLGLLLMVLPDTNTDKQMQEHIEIKNELTVEDRLTEILCALHGAGEVKVMLTEAQGERTIYQTDTTYGDTENSTESRTETILISDSQRDEHGLVHQINPPTYQGAIVLAQGADDPSVRLSIVEAVSNVTGLGADKISVYKMQ